MISRLIWWLTLHFCSKQLASICQEAFEDGFQEGINSALKSGGETTVPSDEWEALKEIDRRIKSEGITPLPTIICKS